MRLIIFSPVVVFHSPFKRSLCKSIVLVGFVGVEKNSMSKRIISHPREEQADNVRTDLGMQKKIMIRLKMPRVIYLLILFHYLSSRSYEM